MMHANNCILASHCKLANTKSCNSTCQHYVACHGMSGSGGRVAVASVPKDYSLQTVKNSPVRQNQQAVYRAVDAYIRTFDRMFDTNSERVKSLYLWSESPGTGKTTTAASILNDWIIAHYLGSIKRGLQVLQQPAYFLDTNDLQTLYNEYNRSHVPKDVAEKASREYYRRLQAAKSAPFAIYDDIGVRTATEGFRGDLHSAINYRTTNALPTVFTSNLPIEEMAQVFDARLYDRMRDMCAVLSFTGESKRGMRK